MGGCEGKRPKVRPSNDVVHDEVKSREPSPQPSPQPTQQPSSQTSPQSSPQTSKQEYYPVVGLQNLGNTCFFNAILQATNQTDELHRLYVMVPYQRQPSFTTSWSYHDPKNNYQNLTAVEYTKKYSVTSKICDEPLIVTVSSLPGPVTSALQKTLWIISQKPSYFTPHELLDALGKCNPRFVRGTQEDSHEVLRCLLDAIKTEELAKVKEEITNTFGPPNDGEDKLKLRGYLRMVSKLPTAIGQAVEGTIISTTICHECHEITENFEPFFDISVPMPDDISTEEENLRKVVSVKSTQSQKPGGQGTTKLVIDIQKPQTSSSTAPQVTSLNESEPENICKTKDGHDMSTITVSHETENSYSQEEIAKNPPNQDVVNAANPKKAIPESNGKSQNDPSTNIGIVNGNNTKQQEGIINSGKQEISANPQGGKEINTNSDANDAREDTPTSKKRLTTDLDTMIVEQSSLKATPTSGSTAAKVNIVYREHRIVPVSSTAQSKKKMHDKTGLQKKLEDDANATKPDDVHREHRIVPISTDQSKEKRNDETGLQKKLEDDANATRADGHCPLATKTTHNRNAFQQYLKGNDFHYQAAETKVSPSKFSLESCLAMHTNLDVLDENNKFICQRCTKEKQKNGSCASDDVVLCQVSKQLTIHKLPPVLILHFRRFDLNGPTVTKDNRYISFPDVLNVAPYCTNECIKTYGDKYKKILYGLYAVVVHQWSSLHCGHYITYVREQLINKPTSHNQHHVEDWREYKANYGRDRRWYYASDTYRRECQYEDVKKCEAYLLFYELLPFDYGASI